MPSMNAARVRRD